jgi:hypothetical protein
MTRTTASTLERLFAQLVAASMPGWGIACAASCGGIAIQPQAVVDGGPGALTPAVDGGPGALPPGPTEGGGTTGEDAGSCAGYPPGCCPNNVVLDGGVPDANVFPDAGITLAQAYETPGALPAGECAALCAGYSYSWGCVVVSAGPPGVVTCMANCSGRRPAGMRAEPARGSSPLAVYFASMAQLEAASVPAFRRMARELEQFRAPRRLVRAAERAARDEIRHARAAAALARRFGAAPGHFEVDECGPRSLEAFALENAVEGCVGETYGAVVATWQARAARDPDARAHMTRIAREETSHAALAWRTHAWARTRLDRRARARVDAARSEALRQLAEAVATSEPDAGLAAFAGVPGSVVAGRLARGLAAAAGGRRAPPALR